MKLFKIIASKAGRVVFDDRIEAPSPREARDQMKTLLGLQSLTGVVYAVTEIPVDLIQSIVDARITEALQRLKGGQPPASVEALIRPIAGDEVREQLASLREQIAAIRSAPASATTESQRFDAFTATTESSIEDRVLGSRPETAAVSPPKSKRQPRPSVTTNGTEIDWKTVKRHYLRSRSHKQTAAHFELSVNTVKARARKEGWGQ